MLAPSNNYAFQGLPVLSKSPWVQAATSRTNCLPLHSVRSHGRAEHRRAFTVHSSMRPYLEQLVKLKDLTAEDAENAVRYAVSGKAEVAEIAAFLALLAAKKETAEEISGIARAMRAAMRPVHLHGPVLDIVGTGGDGANTVNISTAAAILAAAAGCKIAKHGNRSVSSKSGSADVLEALGVHLSLSADGVSQCVEEAGIAFMFARNHHPAMAAIAPVRKALNLRTVFNIMGPLLNPASAELIVLGVYDPSLLDVVADALILDGIERAVVVHTAGLDEYSNTGVSEVVEVTGKQKVRQQFDPVEVLGMPRVDVSALKGGDAAENAEIIRQVLAGKLPGPITDAIALNAGVGCYLYGLDNSIEAGVQRVMKVVESGQAVATLEKWAEVSQRAAESGS